MNRVLARMISFGLIVAFSGLVLPGLSFAENKKEVSKEEYERILAAAKKKGCTQVKGCK